MCLEIISRHELDDGKIAAGSFHQVFGTAVSKTVFAVFLIYYIHIVSFLPAWSRLTSG
jgi:hypothetical protein